MEYDPQENSYPKCPFCNSEEECEHLLAILDRTFIECNGGYALGPLDELYQYLESTFKNLIESDQPLPTGERVESLENLFYSTKQLYEENGEINLDGFAYYDMLEDLFIKHGAKLIDYAEDFGRPGFDSLVKTYYAENPESVFNQSVMKVKQVTS